MQNNVVGPRVREARLLHNPKLTQTDLAARLELEGWHLGRAGVAKIELGLRQVTDIELIRLATALHTSPNWLLNQNDSL